MDHEPKRQPCRPSDLLIKAKCKGKIRQIAKTALHCRTMSLTTVAAFTYQRFAPVLPALDAQRTEARRHRVAIVGGGPVGLAAALGLARWGIASMVVEADDAVCEGSRAICISRRSLEILQRFGAARALMDKGLPWTRGRSFYGTQEVLTFDMPSSAGDKYPPMLNVQQYYIEQFLLDAIDAVNRDAPGRIDVRWASRVIDCHRQEDGVTLRIENAQGCYHACADWLLACDGGQSTIRAGLGLSLQGTGYEGRYVIVDIELESDHCTERRAWFDPPWARGTTILMHRQPDNVWRLDWQLAPGQDAGAALQPQALRQMVQSHLDAIGEGGKPWNMVWSSIYRAGAMTLARYRHGRILFAGNAAHALPIFGVRGLNSGFDDVDNLVWKLAAVLHGRACEPLLDSYSHERVQAFHVNAEHAMRSTEFMSPPHRGFDLMREACLSLAARHTGIARLINPRQTNAITYADSPLSSDAQSDRVEGVLPLGASLVDVPITGGQRRTRHLIDTLFPQGFTLLMTHPWPQQPAFEAAHAASSWLPCRCVPIAPEVAVRAQLGDVLTLVRPDGHLCGRWRAPSADVVLAAIARACGDAATQPSVKTSS